MSKRRSLAEIVMPLQHRQAFGLSSFCFVFLMVFSEIEGLAFTVVVILLGRLDLFMSAQIVLAPAAYLVATSAAASLYWRARSWARKRLHDYTQGIEPLSVARAALEIRDRRDRAAREARPADR